MDTSRLRDDSGLSLTELLVVSVLISVILAASYFLFGAATSMNDLAMARAIASDQAQLAVDQMSRDLRQAQENVAEKGVFVTAEANQMKFTADLNHDEKPELVRYYVENDQLKRTVAQPTAGQTMPPFTFQTAGTPKVLVEELGTSAGPLFCYHSTVVNNTVLCGTAKHGFNVVTTADPLNTTPKISMIGIKLDVESTSGAKTVAVINRALVRMRTIENTVK